MNLLVVFFIALVIGQSISVSVGLLAERLFTPYTGLVTFIALYFLMFWVTWKIAVRLTEPRSHVGGSLQSDAR
jgi:membrane protein implicated in regulation of membrane protease activity